MSENCFSNLPGHIRFKKRSFDSKSNSLNHRFSNPNKRGGRSAVLEIPVFCKKRKKTSILSPCPISARKEKKEKRQASPKPAPAKQGDTPPKKLPIVLHNNAPIISAKIRKKKKKPFRGFLSYVIRCGKTRRGQESRNTQKRAGHFFQSKKSKRKRKKNKPALFSVKQGESLLICLSKKKKSSFFIRALIIHIMQTMGAFWGVAFCRLLTHPPPLT